MKITRTAQFGRTTTVLFLTVAALLGVTKVAGQTVFTVTNLAPVPSTGVSVDITAPNPLFHNSGTTSNNITPVTFGTDIYFLSPGPDSGASNPGFNFNGTITGTSIPAGTTIPISYNFTLGKNLSIPGTVTWALLFSDNQNTSPFLIASGALTTGGAASATFFGLGNYTFTTGSPSTFKASLELTYTTGFAMTNPLVTISMANSGYGGEGITLNGSAIPEPSTYAALAGLAAFGLVIWRRRRQPPAAG